MKNICLRALVLALLVTAAFEARAQELTLNEALSVPAEDLARSCLADLILEQFLILADSGSTIQTPNGAITDENVADVRLALEGRMGVCAAAIQVRGQTALPRHVTVLSSAGACKNVGSSWADVVSEDLVQGIETNLEEFPGILSTTIMIDGRDKSVEQPFVQVESALAMMDYSNTSYIWLGTVSGDRITFRPDVRVLDSWPEWAAPPKKKNLEKCRIEVIAKAAG